jgi:hypothetical protein
MGRALVILRERAIAFSPKVSFKNTGYAPLVRHNRIANAGGTAVDFDVCGLVRAQNYGRAKTAHPAIGGGVTASLRVEVRCCEVGVNALGQT